MSLHIITYLIFAAPVSTFHIPAPFDYSCLFHCSSPEKCFCCCALFHSGKVQQSRNSDSFEEKPDSSSKGSVEDIRSFLEEDSAPMWRYDQIKKECGKVMQSHFGTVVNCARLGSQSPQCCELFSMFGSQSSLALLLWSRALVRSIGGDGSVIFR